MPTEVERDTVPPLKVLAAQKVCRMSLNAFFKSSSPALDDKARQKLTVHLNNFRDLLSAGPIDPEAEKYIEAVMNAMIKARTEEKLEDYTRRVDERDKKIEACHQTVQYDSCAAYSLGFSGCIIMSAAHIGLYLLLDSTVGLSPYIRRVFLATLPASILVGICLGMFSTLCLGKALGSCVYPPVSKKITIDLEKELELMESGQANHMGP